MGDMFKQVGLPLLGVMAFIFIVGMWVQKNSKLNPLNVPGAVTTSSKVVLVNGREVKVEVADSDEKRKAGLSGRTTLAENTGMLFVFNPQDVKPVFWMKDTLIPLDIIWINDNKVVKIDVNVQPPKEGTPESALPKYSPSMPVDYVLEVPANFTIIHSTQVGDPVDLSKI